MRNNILTIAAVLLSGALTAQGVFSNKTQSILEKVIQDYPHHFHNIRGELVSQAHQTSAYRSTVQLPGSPSCMVVLTGAGSNGAAAGEGYSWACTVLDAESFEKAQERFHDIYGQLSNSIIHTNPQKTFILSGQYEEPSVDRKVTRVVFSLVPGVGEMKWLRVELRLQRRLLLLRPRTTSPMMALLLLLLLMPMARAH